MPIFKTSLNCFPARNPWIPLSCIILRPRVHEKPTLINSSDCIPYENLLFHKMSKRNTSKLYSDSWWPFVTPVLWREFLYPYISNSCYVTSPNLRIDHSKFSPLNLITLRKGRLRYDSSLKSWIIFSRLPVFHLNQASINQKNAAQKKNRRNRNLDSVWIKKVPLCLLVKKESRLNCLLK